MPCQPPRKMSASGCVYCLCVCICMCVVYRTCMFLRIVYVGFMFSPFWMSYFVHTGYRYFILRAESYFIHNLRYGNCLPVFRRKTLELYYNTCFLLKCYCENAIVHLLQYICKIRWLKWKQKQS